MQKNVNKFRKYSKNTCFVFIFRIKIIFMKILPFALIYVTMLKRGQNYREKKGSFMDGYEIERKFLVDKTPPLEAYPFEHIIQAYISVEPEIRIRKKGEKYFLTEKSGYGLVRKESEREISEQEFLEAYEKTEGRVLTKTRYCIPYDKYTLELDVYEGKNAGLVVCEIEFDNIDEANNFIPPEWFGKDITDDKNYKNKVLAEKEEIDG